MYNILLTIQYASVVILFVEAAYIFMNWKTRTHGVLFLSCVATLINCAGYLVEMTSGTSVESYKAGLKMSYLGRSFIPYALLLFVLSLCNKKWRKWLLLPLAGIHFGTFILVFNVGREPGLYYSSEEFVTSGVFPHCSFGHGPWYIAYFTLIIIYIVYGISILTIYAVREKNPLNRKKIFFVVASIAVESFFYIFSFVDIIEGYDLTMTGYTFAAVIMCYAIFRYDLLETMELAKDFVLDDISEGIIVFDQNGKEEYLNSSARKLLKENASDELIKQVEAAVDKKEPINIDGRIFSPEKKKLSHKGTDCGVVYVLSDDTEHYEYMEKLKAQKELAEAAREEAESANASKSAFISVVSHEIRTPMNAVVGMTDLLLREKDKLTDKQFSYLSNIKNSGSALVMIVNDILDQSKIEAGKMEIVEDVYEIRPMVSDVKMIIENRIEKKPVHLIMEVGDEIPELLIGDSLRIRQILINLMNNAVKFTEEGYIHLAIKCADPTGDRIKIRFSVKDSGQGIKPEDLNRLGEAFSQVDTKKNHGKEGTGLGLSISKDFIRMMGGQLEVTSTYGRGSEFFFTIEQGVPESTTVEANPGSPRKQAWQEEESFTCPEAKILVVDDTEINLMIMAEMLEPLKMQVDTVNSGEKAVKLVEENRYNLVFMDYMMPSMDGVEATEKIRELAGMTKDEELANYYLKLPIVSLTGDDSEATKEKFKLAGIDDFTTKPVELKRLKTIFLQWLPKELIVADGEKR